VNDILTNNMVIFIVYWCRVDLQKQQKLV